jgi:pimeloyl-ACP methyl ester carboxylesterase
MDVALVALYCLLFIGLMLLIGITYERTSIRRDRRNHKTPVGQLQDIGGYQLHYILKGERKEGQPLVILEAGIGQNVLDWQRVQPSIAEFAQVLAYDRAGYGWSDAGKEPRNPKQLIADLHALLEKLELKPPYLLVGHRFGGMFMRLFIETYPDEVVGLVLVESSHPDVVNKEDNEPHIKRLNRNKTFFQPIGLVRWLSRRSKKNPSLYLDAAAKEQYVARMILDNENIVREQIALFREKLELKDSISLPLTIVSRKDDQDLAQERRWSVFQHDLAKLAPHSKHIHAESTSHWLLMAEPETVVKAVKEQFEEITS